jgi:hypothetical protein
VPEGEAGWGAAGVLDLGQIMALAKARSGTLSAKQGHFRGPSLSTFLRMLAIVATEGVIGLAMGEGFHGHNAAHRRAPDGD